MNVLSTERDSAFVAGDKSFLLSRNHHTKMPVWIMLLKICKSCLIFNFINYVLNMRYVTLCVMFVLHFFQS